MEATAVAQSFRGMHLPNAILRKAPVPQLPVTVKKLISPTSIPRRTVLSLKASSTPVVGKAEPELSEKLDKTSWNSFPDGFQKLVLEVCDETEVAEVMVKVGDFEMHLKRNVGASKPPTPIISPTTAPPIPSEPMNESAPASLPPTPQKSSPATNVHFTNASSAKASKLAALNASGTNTYVVVSSPTVGSFRSARTIKGKKQPPSCKEGDMIKEGQVIGYLDQFGNELPVKSNVAGEVLKVLFKDGEAVGFGDPLVAVLPSFHGINKF